MGIFQEQNEQRAPVAICESAASANFVATTLSINGISATTAPYDHAYPSISWAQGYRVVIDAADLAEAEELLRQLSRTDVAMMSDVE